MIKRWVPGLLLGISIAILGYAFAGVREVYFYNPDPTRAKEVALVYGAAGFVVAASIFVLSGMLFRLHSRARGFFSGLLSLLLLLCGYLLYFLNKYWLSGIPWYTWPSIAASVAVAVAVAAPAVLLYRVSSRLKPDFRAIERWILPVLPAVFLFAVIVRLTGSMSPGKHPAATQNHPNVIIVVLDTVRRDFVSSYGYPLPTTPAFDSVARNGVLFEDAQTVSCWTLPSVVGMLASGLPGKDILPGASSAKLTATTLPEVMRKAGYYSAGVGSNPHVAGPFGVYQKFEKFYDGQPEWRHALAMTSLGDILDRLFPVSDAHLIDIAIKQIRSAPRPFLLYLHLMGAHAPYRVPRNWTPPFKIPSADRDIDFPNPDIGITKQERENLMLRYAARIRYTDEQLGRLLKALDESQVSNSTLLLITADHGEEFGEHGDWTHGRTLYREMLQVPLVMRWPSRLPGGLRYPGIVSHLDIAPTILSLALPGTAIPERWMGNQLSFTVPPSMERGIPAEIPPLQSWTTLEYKYIRDMKNSQEWLFDRRKDPEEKQNLASTLPDLAASFRQELIRNLAESNATLSPSNEISPETEEKLRSLGYIQ